MKNKWLIVLVSLWMFAVASFANAKSDYTPPVPIDRATGQVIKSGYTTRETWMAGGQQYDATVTFTFGESRPISSQNEKPQKSPPRHYSESSHVSRNKYEPPNFSGFSGSSYYSNIANPEPVANLLKLMKMSPEERKKQFFEEAKQLYKEKFGRPYWGLVQEENKRAKEAEALRVAQEEASFLARSELIAPIVNTQKVHQSMEQLDAIFRGEAVPSMSVVDDLGSALMGDQASEDLYDEQVENGEIDPLEALGDVDTDFLISHHSYSDEGVNIDIAIVKTGTDLGAIS